jgi:spore coat assembly protein SafA
MPEPGYDPNAVSSFYNPSSTPRPKLRPSGLGSRPSTADNKGSSAVFSAPKPVYSSNDNDNKSDKRLTPASTLYSATASSLAESGARLSANKETRISPMNLYDQKNMQEMKTELEDYLRGVVVEDGVAADMARMAVPEVYTGEVNDVEVKSGDTLTAIAKDKGVSLKELIDANPQIDDPDLIFPGQKINIPSTEETPVVDIATAVREDQIRQQDTSTLKGSQVGLMSRPATVEDTKMSETILQKTPTDDSLEHALAIASSIKNAKPEDIYNKVIMPLAYHESDGTMDPKLAQYGGGPGRGVMQYEPDRFNSSVVRAIRQFNDLGKDIPEWLDNIDLSGDIQKEITSLTANQQMSLAVYDLLQKRGVDIGEVLSGKESIEDVWADHWWQGPDKQRKKRIAAFRRSQRLLNKNAPSNNITAFEFP